jgi:large conductance mechanosensitive channel
LRQFQPRAAEIYPNREGANMLDPAKKAFSLFEEFKNFALKGNVIDLAVGIVIGTAFTAIVKSLVDNIIMPIVSIPIPTQGGYETWALGPIQIGHFLGAVVNFLIIAFALFLFVVKFLGWIMRAKQEAPPPPPPPLTKDQELLVEIRDLLKSERK